MYSLHLTEFKTELFHWHYFYVFLTNFTTEFYSLITSLFSISLKLNVIQIKCKILLKHL